MNNPQAYVTADGSFGVGAVLLFDESALTDEQWDVVDTMSDNYRYEYIQAVLNQDWQTVNALEEDYA